MNPPALPVCPILGVNVSAIDMGQALGAIRHWIEERRVSPSASAHAVCVTPAHALMDCRDDPDLKAIYNRASMVTPDGMAVVWLLRANGFENVGRVYGPDLLQASVAEGIRHGWSHYFLGGTEQGLERLVGSLQANYPGVAIAGAASPPFRTLDTAETSALIRGINDARPDLLWVGLGSPRQERWIAGHLDELDVAAALGVGAAFDFLSGEKAQAPRLIQRSGLEWLFRLLSEPRRLWPRYRRYPLFVLLALADLRRSRRSR